MVELDTVFGESLGMNDLIEIVEDLESIELHGVDSTAFEAIIEKWEQRKTEAEEFLERQFEMEV